MKDIARIGFVGAGWWAAQNHIPIIAAHEHAVNAAVCRLGKDELNLVKEKFGFEYATEDYQAMLRDVALDGIIVTSPHHLHYEHAHQALEQRLHVMVEKPMTTSTEHARDLVRLSKAVDREILIPHGWNFRHYTPKARELVAGGAIGQIQHVAMLMASPAQALFSGEPYPGTEGDLFRPPPSTWADPASFGGYGWGQLPHVLSCLFRITGLIPQKVMAVSSESKTGVDLFDAVIIQFEDGVNGVLSGAGTVPMNSKFQVDIRLFGSEGMLLLDLERERLCVRRNDDINTDITINEGEGDYICDEPVRRFVDLCRGKTISNEAPGIVGLRSIEVIDAMYRSINSGQTESV